MDTKRSRLQQPTIRTRLPSPYTPKRRLLYVTQRRGKTFCDATTPNHTPSHMSCHWALAFFRWYSRHGFQFRFERACLIVEYEANLRLWMASFGSENQNLSFNKLRRKRQPNAVTGQAPFTASCHIQAWAMYLLGVVAAQACVVQDCGAPRFRVRSSPAEQQCI
jgi:hypothetical protein